MEGRLELDDLLSAFELKLFYDSILMFSLHNYLKSRDLIMKEKGKTKNRNNFRVKINIAYSLVWYCLPSSLELTFYTYSNSHYWFLI